MNTRRHFMRFGAGAIGCACATAFPGLAGAAPATGRFRCPPCGCSMDNKLFDAPGKCPACGMQLVPEAALQVSGVEEGEIEVPENRRDPRSRRIKLRYLRLRSTADQPGNPIVYLAGGPGASGIVEARSRSRALFDALRSVSDVIAFDQRGTGAASAIPPCKAADGFTEYRLTREGMTQHFIAEYRRCSEFWKKSGVAIEGYTTIQSAADLEDLRRALGAPKLNLLGESYGSHLAFAALKYHGATIERVALASIEGLHQTVKRPASLDGIFEFIAARLKEDVRHRAEFPDFTGLMRRVHERLEREPARVVIRPKPDGPPVTVVIGGFVVQFMAGGLAKNPQTLRQLPAFYKTLDAGQYEPLAQQLYAMTRGFTLPLSGMAETMDLASGISAQRLALVQEESKSALLGDALNFPMPQARELAAGFDLGDEFRAPARFDAPALLIAGTLDGRIPVSEQREAGAQFTHAKWVTIENGGHDVLASTMELRPLLIRFFNREPASDATIKLPDVELP